MRYPLLIAALIASPALAQQNIPLPDGSIITRAAWAELKTVDGRARMYQALERASRRICANVHPQRDRMTCQARVLADAEVNAIPPVSRQIRLARQEATTVALAAR